MRKGCEEADSEKFGLLVGFVSNPAERTSMYAMSNRIPQ